MNKDVDFSKGFWRGKAALEFVEWKEGRNICFPVLLPSSTASKISTLTASVGVLQSIHPAISPSICH